jgi:hypothetical protein
MSGVVRRWVVDSVEEGVAAVHQDDGRMVRVPGWILPAGTRQGDVLSVEHSAADDALRRSAEQVERRLPHDPGGDIVL